MKKIITISVIALFVIALGAFYFLKNQNTKAIEEQRVLEQTLKISQEYASLRYQSDNVLLNAKEYEGYDAWKEEMTNIIQEWGELEKNAAKLETEANELNLEKVSFHLVNQALAYDLQEANQIINSAPQFQKISTLAKYYGVDAKMAQLILNQTADQMSRDAYGGEGDVAATYENSAVRIKNGAKVTVFVGTIVATGGTSALAASGALAQTAVVVSGADLALEITEDEARISLGDKNKVSSMVSKIRTVTEPAAGILSIASMPNNLSKAIDKFSVAYLGADQIRSVIQDKKILGISIKIDEKGETKTEIAGLTEDELPQWQKENNAPDSTETVEEIIKQFNQVSVTPIKEEKIEEKKTIEKNELMGVREFNQLSDDEQLKTMKQVREFFGEPDFTTVNKFGRTVYIYLDRIQDGLRSGIRFAFYTLDDYKKIAESAFGWNEDYQKIWNDSEGGLTATTEVKNNEYFQALYGL